MELFIELLAIALIVRFVPLIPLRRRVEEDVAKPPKMVRPPVLAAHDPTAPYEVVTEDESFRYDDNGEAKDKWHELQKAGQPVSFYKNGKWRG